MAVTLSDYSTIAHHILKLEDEHLQQILDQIMQEHIQYAQIGTAEELREYKQIAEYSPKQWMNLLKDLSKVHQECVEELAFKHERSIRKLRSKYEADLRRRKS